MTLIIILGFSACRKMDPFSFGIKVGNLIYVNETVFLGSDELDLLKEINDNTMIFSSQEGALKSVSKTSILVIGVSDKTPYGSLRKVVSISSDGDDFKITTTDALLTDAVKEGTINFKKTLSEKDFSLNSKIDGILAKSPNKSFDGIAVTLNEFELYREGAKIAKLTGSIGVSTDIEMTILIEASRIKDISLKTELTKIDEISLSSNGAFSGQKEVTLAGFTHIPVIIDSLVFVPEIKINSGFDGTTLSQVSAGVRQDRTLTSKLTYKDSKWSDDPLSHTESFDLSEPNVSDNSELKVYSGPEISLKLLGVELQNIKANGYYTLEANKAQNPFWKLFIGNEGSNTFKSSFLGLPTDHSSEILVQRSEIGNGK